MPSITIHLTDLQKKLIDDHFKNGLLIELEEETMHGISYKLSSAMGMWFLDVNSQAGDLFIDEIDVEFKE